MTRECFGRVKELMESTKIEKIHPDSPKYPPNEHPVGVHGQCGVGGCGGVGDWLTIFNECGHVVVISATAEQTEGSDDDAKTVILFFFFFGWGSPWSAPYPQLVDNVHWRPSVGGVCRIFQMKLCYRCSGLVDTRKISSNGKVGLLDGMIVFFFAERREWFLKVIW